MIELVQLGEDIRQLMLTLKGARAFYEDPFYIAWLVYEVLDGQAPTEDALGCDYVLVNSARKDPRFRAFWEQFQKVASSLELFGNAFTADTRAKYQERRIKNREVPF